MAKKRTKSKKVAKKAAKPKKTAKKAPAKKIDFKKRVRPEHCFYLIDGSTVASLKELLKAFEKMSDDVFYYHVTPDRHDFSNWIKDVFKEVDLAEKLLESRTKLECEVALLRRILKNLE